MCSRDLLALLAGLRPAVMLDYIADAPEDALCQLAAEVASFVPSLPRTPGAPGAYLPNT